MGYLECLEVEKTVEFLEELHNAFSKRIKNFRLEIRFLLMLTKKTEVDIMFLYDLSVKRDRFLYGTGIFDKKEEEYE